MAAHIVVEGWTVPTGRQGIAHRLPPRQHAMVLDMILPKQLLDGFNASSEASGSYPKQEQCPLANLSQGFGMQADRSWPGQGRGPTLAVTAANVVTPSYSHPSWTLCCINARGLAARLTESIVKPNGQIVIRGPHTPVGDFSQFYHWLSTLGQMLQLVCVSPKPCQ
jgi:hypothetical protein